MPAGRGVGQTDVLIVEQVLLDVVGADRLSVGDHRAGDGQQLLDPGDVDGHDPVHLLTGQSGPDPRRQRCGDVEFRGQSQVPEVDPGEEPTPVALEVTGRVDLAGRKDVVTGGDEAAQIHRAVRGGGHTGVEEGPGSGPHLGIVGRQHQIVLGALQDSGHRRRHRRRLGQTDLGVVELGHELIVLGGQGAEQGLGRTGVHRGQLMLGRQ